MSRPFSRTGWLPALIVTLLLGVGVSPESGLAADPDFARELNALARANRARNGPALLNALPGSIPEAAATPSGTPAARGIGAGFTDCNGNGVDDAEDLLPQFGVGAAEAISSNGRNVIDIELADMTGDDVLDVVMAHRSSNNVSVLRNDGDGSFTALALTSCGAGPWLLEVADFDGDDDVDAATINRGGRNISVLLNRGDGTFAPARTVNLPWEPFGFDSADMDEDGDVDLVVAGGPNSCLLFRNNGSATFTAAPAFTASFPNSVAIGDVDGNGRLDILVGSSPNVGQQNAVVIIRQASTGAFSPPIRHSVPSVPLGMKVVDLDDDADGDLAFVGWQGGGLTVMRNDGVGRFVSPVTLRFSGQSLSVEACDVDLDGTIDLLSAEESGGAVYLFRNRGRAQFDGGAIVSMGGFAFQAACGDIDEDGDSDILSANGNSNTVGLARVNTGPLSTDLNDNGVPDECEPDCNWNLRPDELDLSDGTSLDCNGNDTPDECDVIPALWLDEPGIHESGANAVDVVAVDLDGDGRLDYATADRQGGTVTVALNESDGDGIAFGSGSSTRTGAGPWKIAAGDLDEDGLSDLATINQDGQSVSVFLNAGRDESGDWQGVARRLDRTLPFRPFGIVIARVGRAGQHAIAAVGGDPGFVQVIDHDDGAFTLRARQSLSGPPNAVVAADLDGNGETDLIAPVSNGRLSFLMGQGNGVLSHTSMPFSGPGFDALPMVVAAADLDGDDHQDLAVVTFGSKIVTLLNNGTGRFAVDSVFNAPQRAFEIKAVDLDSDGDADLATVSEVFEVLAIYRNDGSDGEGGPRFAGPFGYLADGASFRLDSGDLDGDERPDLLVALGFDNGVNSYRNASLAAVSVDCGTNGVPDECEPELHPDDNDNGIDDSCEPDCNENGVPDVTDIANGDATDCNEDGVPDSCEPDCDGDDRSDICQLASNPALDCDGNGIMDSCDIASGRLDDANDNGVPDVCERPFFHRGDSNHDGGTDITDGVIIFGFLFLGEAMPVCLEAANPNDDDMVDVSDGIYLLNYLFNGGPAPVDPGPTEEPCGQDPEGSSDLGCERYEFCG